MRHFGQHRTRRSMRPRFVVVSAFVAAVAVSMTAGTAAAHGGAAAHKGYKAAHKRYEANVGFVRFYDGTLAVRGGNRDDRLALGLQAGNPAVLQVDVATTAHPTSASRARRSPGSSSTEETAATRCGSTRATVSSPTRSRRRSRAATGTTDWSGALGP